MGGAAVQGVEAVHQAVGARVVAGLLGKQQALFNAFGSAEKTMHINPGKHVGIPAFEAADWEAFYLRHLGRAADAP